MADRFRLTIEQLNPTMGDLAGNAAQAKDAWEQAKAAGAAMVALPEMFIAGYNAQDLPMKHAFTLDCMAADLGRAFAKGQTYVALSRVREVHHAEVKGLTFFKLNDIDKAALRFYKACEERSQERLQRHREKERQAEMRGFLLDDAALNQMMDSFEAGQ